MFADICRGKNMCLRSTVSLFLLLFAAVPLKGAVLLNGTFGFAPVGTVTYNGASLGEAESVKLPSTEIVNTVPLMYNRSPNDFYSGPNRIPLLSYVSIDPLTLQLPSVGGSFVSVNYLNFLVVSDGTTPAGRYDFNLVELMKTSAGGSDLEVYGQGILHDTQGIFADTPALLSIAFTQPGSGGAVNASFSLASTTVPEPGTVAAGVIAFGVAARGMARLGRKR
jgi:hypothetical protein